MPAERMVYAVISSHLDCPEYIFEDCINLSSQLLPNLNRTARDEGGQVELMTQTVADKMHARYCKRFDKMQKEKEKAKAKLLKEQQANGGNSESGCAEAA